MCARTLARLTGLLLIVTPVLFNVSFTLLHNGYWQLFLHQRVRRCSHSRTRAAGPKASATLSVHPSL